MKNKSKHFIWIILLFATNAASVHTNCDRPPHIENGSTKPLVEDDNEDLVSVTYVCNDGFTLQGEAELLCNLDTDEWQGEPPTCNPDHTTTERNGKKINISDIPEDTSIDSIFARTLDRSCFIEPRVMPPEIENAVFRNLRRQKDGRIFPVAVYTCDEDYELENEDNDRLYCSKREWIGIHPNCMQLEETYDEGEDEEEEEDYDNANGNEEEEVEEGGEEDGEEEEEEQEEEVERENERENTEHKPDETENEIENNEIDGNHENEQIDQESDPLAVGCAENQGGCDHKCNIIDNRINCECFAGFKLDENDGRTCHDINECDYENGGCESICINQPGSFKCDCEKGLQIDTVGRTKCLDINECLLRNGHGPCQDTCINTFGGYQCSCYNLPGTKLAKNGRNCEDAGKCAIRNGGCSQGCVSAAGRVYCLCDRGYYLESDRKTCQDIDECADPEINSHCPRGCENTQGSYHCKEETTQAPIDNNGIENEEDNNVPLTANNSNEENPNASENEIQIIPNRIDDDNDDDENEGDDNNEENNEIYDQNILKTCGDGYELDESNRCVDIDECAIGNTGCQFCKNVHGGFECTCPDGFDLADDERTCQDINECEMQTDYEETDGQETNTHSPCSHDCINTHGSYLCVCPDNFHLQYDHRTCVRDFCEHLTDELNKTKCSHNCVDEKDGYVCKCPPGVHLDTDFKTCLVNNQCDQENHCSPGECVNTEDGYRCECPSGYVEKAKRCHDENECEIGNHQCSHECRNLDGSYECLCPTGYTLAEDRRICRDVDECADDDEGDLCGDMDCMNTIGSYKCQCPEGQELITVESGSICREIDLCEEANGGCSHGCRMERSEIHCYCPDGMKLQADGKNCGKLNKCEDKNGDCSQVCNSVTQVCECHSGFELSADQKTCIDVNECEHKNGGCSHICINLLGSYQCSCPNEGQFLVNDEKTCEYVNECELNNGGCSHECEYTNGTHKCVCPSGYKFRDGSTKSCEDIDECLANNGGCSFQCKNYEGRHECLCKLGFELGRDKKTCIDVDECIDFNGNCTNICLNLHGSYACACETGFQLFDDQHTCIDIDECEESLNDCSHTCVNVPGTYECSCPVGFSLGVDHFTCEDINECETVDCSHQCVNTEGSYYCTCSVGHKLLSDNKTCADIDECNDDSFEKCSHGCANSIGGFECHCPSGLELGTDARTCQDINECNYENGNCSHICENFEGSYRCLCPSGFKLDADRINCIDVDECAVRNGDCEHVCTNYDGGHRCDCLDGFTIKEDGRHCDSKDLCSKLNGGCEHLCKTVDDRIQCGCRNGFKLNNADNKSCVDVNECEGSHGCQHDCFNVIGSFKCKCRSGHRMNDKGQCIDIDECQYFNGGCSSIAKCINLVGGFRCHCPVGHKLSPDKKRCVEIKDHCVPLPKPKNGEIQCSRSRHRTQLFYKIKCTITCQPGFELIGEAFRHCNGTGHWDEGSSTCAPKLCPRLQRPSHGTITPSNCMIGDTFSGQRCVLHCDPGFKPLDRRTAFCEPPRNWLPNPDLSCVPVLSKLEMIKPHIKCPRDSIILLPEGKKTIHIKLEQPNTNVDWWKYVDSHPPWAKKLEAHLAPGVHTILFKARSPNSNLNDICRTIITVKETQPPAVIYCPESTVEYLQPNEDSRIIYFKEPMFRSEHIKDVFKSKLPGEKFGPGEHLIRYVATDLDDQSSKCEFTISVKPAYHRRNIHHNDVIKAKPLENHESYVKCPGKPAVKIDTNFPINLARGCLIKNIRIPAYSHIRRRHHPSSNSVLRHYSSWDNPDKPASFIHQYRRGWD